MFQPEPDPVQLDKIRQCVTIIKHSNHTDDEIARQIYSIMTDEPDPKDSLEVETFRETPANVDADSEPEVA